MPSTDQSTNHQPTILVTTPTGNVGSRVVQLLLQAGVTPRVLVRDPARLDTEVRARVDVRTADQLDADDVRRATEGVDAVYWVSPEVFTTADPLADLTAMADHLDAAVRANGVPRVVLQSSVGAEVRHGAGLLDGLAYAETRLDALADELGTHVLHLRCGYFFTNLLGSLDALRAGVLPTTAAQDVPVPWVDPRDIGEVAAARLLAAAWTGREVQAVHGPADLTWVQVADLLSEVLDRRIELTVSSDEEQRTTLLEAGLSAAAADGIVGMTAGLREGFVPEQERTVLTTTPTTLAAWAYAVLRPALET